MTASKILVEAMEDRIDVLEQALADVAYCAEFYNDPLRRLDMIEVTAKNALNGYLQTREPSRRFAWQITNTSERPF